MNDEKLIEYLFGLCDEPERRRIEQRLASSADDRARVEQLKAKFAQLDLIKEDVQASEPLIADTLRRARLTPAPKRPGFDWRYFWVPVSALAAAFLVILVLPKPDVTLPSPAEPATEGYEVTLATVPEPLDELQPMPELPAEPPVLVAGSPPPDDAVEIADADARSVPAALPHASASVTMAVVKMDRQTLGLGRRPAARPSPGAPHAAGAPDDTRPAWTGDGLVWNVERHRDSARVTVSNTTAGGIMVQFDTNSPSLVPAGGVGREWSCP